MYPNSGKSDSQWEHDWVSMVDDEITAPTPGVSPMSFLRSREKSQRERAYPQEAFNYCRNNNVSLPNIQEDPDQLKQLLENTDIEGVNFRQNIRNYNSMCSFASFGANVTSPPGRSPYCFRL
ncbi:uncharacterized protein LOC128247385 [Octopus bimaculoides]|uniref:uncharacterized protein LOC128247385 n=1 Tax=Octopus bimaculoides TaxID=37653 RepID=UPI0022E5B403|nr:uncharacterized protein LOC128247385 [Octopus bimaculoides]